MHFSNIFIYLPKKKKGWNKVLPEQRSKHRGAYGRGQIFMSCHRRYASQMSGQSNYNLGGTMSFLNTEDMEGAKYSCHATEDRVQVQSNYNMGWDEVISE